MSDRAGHPSETDLAAATYCDHCGGELDAGDHDDCRRRRALEPPRFCPLCRRRMRVQVLPRGWSARCSVHGAI